MSHFRQQPPLPLRPFLIEGLFYYFQLYVCVWSVYGYVHMKARGLGFGQSGCWGLNLGLLQECYLLFTAEPPLQLCFFFVNSLCPSTCFKSPWGVCVCVWWFFFFFSFSLSMSCMILSSPTRGLIYPKLSAAKFRISRVL